MRLRQKVKQNKTDMNVNSLVDILQDVQDIRIIVKYE